MRLNKHMRETIIRAATQKMYQKKIEELENSVRVLIMDIYKTLVSDPIRLTLKSLPPHLVVRTSEVQLTWVEDNRTFSLGKRKFGNFYTYPISLHDPIFHPGQQMPVTRPVHLKRAKFLVKKQAEVLEQKQKAVGVITTLVKQAVTVEQLEQAWPEGKKYLREFKEVTEGLVQQQKPKTPAIILDKDLLKEALK